MLERRNFLTALSATMLAAAMPASAMAAVSGQKGKSGSLRKQFAQLVGSNVRLLNSAGVTQKARLIAIDDGPACPGLEQFSIVFEGSDLGEGTYQIRNWRFGRMLVSMQNSGKPGAANTLQRAYFSNFI
jgi:hypothetical protein